MSHLILASASPRRSELLAGLGIPFDVVPSRIDEELPGDLPISLAVEDLALRKAREVSGRAAGGRWVLAADTVVLLGTCTMGKPANRGDAQSMLLALSGRTHRVVTGVALLGPDFLRKLSVGTDVTFQRLSPSLIDWYTSHAEPYDKAGAYAIQGRGAVLVKQIQGSYTNVVGLPMAETAALLEEADLTPWGRREAELDGRPGP